MTDIGWRMDGHLPWRLAFVREAAEHALQQSQWAQAKVAALRKEGLKPADPRRRAASREARERHLTYMTLLEVREILAPPVWRDGQRRGYNEAQAAVLNEAELMGRQYRHAR